MKTGKRSGREKEYIFLRSKRAREEMNVTENMQKTLNGLEASKFEEEIEDG